MSATQLIEQIKALPAAEKAVFVELFRQLEANGNDHAPPLPARWPDFAARRRRIFGERILPNMVLLAREQERW